MNRRTLNIKNRQNSQIPRDSKKYRNYQPIKIINTAKLSECPNGIPELLTIKNINTAKFTKTPKTNTGTLNITTNNTAKLSELKINEKNTKLSEIPK